nr:LarC family nickel insertion protein [Aneurinibacillus sp. XH2]
MRIAYLDCFSGISGDMTLAALVDAGADRGYIERELTKLNVEPFTLEWKRVDKCGISALKMNVILDPESLPQHHRHYSDIVRMIEQAGFSDRARTLSLAIFEKIGIAEGKIHNLPLDRVHFHEVGAIDSIVDVIGVALALDSLQVEQIISSPVPLGHGKVRCDHGLYPVPAPATLEMMKGLPIAECPFAMEMTTPTGAGIVAGIVDQFSPALPPMIIEEIGYGAGTRNLPNQPNVLRAVIGEAQPKPSASVAAVYIAGHHHGHEHHEHDHGHHHHHGHGHHEHEHGHQHHHGHEHHEHEHGHQHHHEHEHHEHEHGHQHHHEHEHHEHEHEHGHHHHHGHEHHEHEHGHHHHHGHEHHEHEHGHHHHHGHKHHEHKHGHHHHHGHEHHEHEHGHHHHHEHEHHEHEHGHHHHHEHEQPEKNEN